MVTLNETATPSPEEAEGVATLGTTNEAWPLATGVKDLQFCVNSALLDKYVETYTAGWPSYVITAPFETVASPRATEAVADADAEADEDVTMTDVADESGTEVVAVTIVEPRVVEVDMVLLL